MAARLSRFIVRLGFAAPEALADLLGAKRHGVVVKANMLIADHLVFALRTEKHL